MTTFRTAVAPVLAAYVLTVAVILYAARRPSPRPPRSVAPRTRRDLAGWLRHLAVTAAGGYVALPAIVLVFHEIVVGDPGGLSSAAWGGAFLLLVAVPAFLVLSLLFGRRPG